ncbi:hypothetical protein KIPB_015019, partial [Kipferlia bialata]|eukprot:g15019.t1
MPSAEMQYRTVDVGHEARGRSALAYIGPLNKKGRIPGKLKSGETYSVLIVGQNSQNPSNHCVIVTLDPANQSFKTGVVQCPLPPNIGYMPATRVGYTVYVFGGHVGSNLDTLYAYTIGT